MQIETIWFLLLFFIGQPINGYLFSLGGLNRLLSIVLASMHLPFLLTFMRYYALGQNRIILIYRD